MADAVRGAYARGEDDEECEPLVLVDSSGAPIGRFGDGDSVIFYDIRGEREVELTRVFVEPGFDRFRTKSPLRLDFMTMVEYDKNLPVRVAFRPRGIIRNTLCEVLDGKGAMFARIAESEKALHITYFLDGKTHRSFRNEERIIVPSSRTSPERNPEMRLDKIADAVTLKMRDKSCRVILANFANVDVVGHFENRKAAVRAVEAVDKAVGKVIKEARRNSVAVIITADHGSVEKWLYPDGTIDTGHTDSPVPFIVFNPGSNDKRDIRLRNGTLADIAPTLLGIAGIGKPRAMTGESLIMGKNIKTASRLCLLILDGWGVGKGGQCDLISQARTPNMDGLWEKCPHAVLKAAGSAVGNPEGTVGNSEVGHLHIGAGRVVESDRLRIEKALKDGSFYSNRQILKFIRGARKTGVLHLLGIVSFYSSHGSVEYLKTFLRMAKTQNVEKVYIHSILGRRGEKAQSGAQYIEDIERFAHGLANWRVASVIGRHWALDREENWDRVEKTYRLLVHGEGRAVWA
jgi:2,3-bisphosphoglycerate-independent phosphoglycerate mutase